MSRIPGLALAASVLTLGLTSATQAAPIFTGSAVGTWQNLQAAGTGNVYSISNNDAVNHGSAVFRFGVGSGTGPNTFTFNGVGSDPSTAAFNTMENTPFNIGSFNYLNGNTTNYPANSSIDLGIALSLTSPVTNNTNFAYEFGIDLTPNTTGNPVSDGDIVTIANGLTSTDFTANGTTYTLQLLGFSTDGGKTFTSQFLSPEGSTANADIYATITTNVMAVPEPGTLGLLGGGLFVLGMTLRRKIV